MMTTRGSGFFLFEGMFEGMDKQDEGKRAHYKNGRRSG